MKLTPGSAISRVTAVSLLALSGFCFFIFIAYPIYGAYQEKAGRISQKQTLLDRYQTLTQVDKTIERNSPQPGQRKLIYDESSDNATAAEVQKRAETVLAESGAALVSVQTLPPSELSLLRQIGVRIRMTGDLSTVRKVLHGLEYQGPALMLDNLSIAARSFRTANGQGLLDVGVDVVGYKRRGGQ